MVNVCHRSEGVIACCGYLWWDGDTQTVRGETFAWRLEGDGWETVRRTQERSQCPSERVANEPDVRVGEESRDIGYEVLSENVNFARRHDEKLGEHTTPML